MRRPRPGKSGRDQRHARHADRSAEPACRLARTNGWARISAPSAAAISAGRQRASEIYDTVRDHKTVGFVTISGDRHSSGPAMPPPIAASRVRPGRAEFITGSISAPGLAEARRIL